MSSRQTIGNLDGFVLLHLAQELNFWAKDAFLQKIRNLDNLDYVLNFYRHGLSFKLRIGLHPNRQYCGLAKDTPAAQSPSSFTMQCRKHIGGAPLKQVRVTPYEREMSLLFANDFSLVVRFLSPSNLYLVHPNNTVLGLQGRCPDNRPGKPFQPLVPDAGVTPPSDGRSLLDLLVVKSGSVIDSFSDCFPSFPQRYWRLLIEHEGLASESLWEEVSLEQRSGLAQGWSKLHSLGLGWKGHEPDWVVHEWSQEDPFPEACALRNWAAKEIAQDNGDPALQRLKKELWQKIKRLKKTARKNLKLEQQRLQTALESGYLKTWGDMLLAYGFQHCKGDPRLVLQSWENPDEEVVIKIAPDLTATEQAEKYYKKYQKFNRSIPHVEERVQILEERLQELEELELYKDMATTISGLQDLFEQLPARSKQRKKKKSPQGSSKPYRFEAEGHTFLVGRNPRQNEKLTFQTANKWDYWFHARGYPGSHVILRLHQQEQPSDSLLSMAAALAANYSKAQGQTVVDVIVCRVKDVTKITGGRPGKVIFKNDMNLAVRPEQWLSQLKETTPQDS